MTVATPTEIKHPVIKSAHLRAVSLPPNTVQVWPGGATFTTITDAINSIQGATPQEQYQVVVGPGTYNEIVWLKDNVFVSGAGATKTTVTWALGGAACGTIAGCGNSGVGMMTVNGTNGGTTSLACALYGGIDGSIVGEGLVLNANDNGVANSTVAAVSNLAGSGNFTFQLASCTINAQASGAGTTVMGVQIQNAPSSANIELSTITASGSNGVGCITAGQATIIIEDSTVTGAQYSLSNDDQQSPITASGCTLNGPVTPGVTVNP